MISSNSRWGSTKILLYSTYVKKGKTLNCEAFVRHLTHKNILLKGNALCTLNLFSVTVKKLGVLAMITSQTSMQTQFTEAIFGRFHIYTSCYFTVCHSADIRIRTINRKSRLTALIPNNLWDVKEPTHEPITVYRLHSQ